MQIHSFGVVWLFYKEALSRVLDANISLNPLATSIEELISATKLANDDAKKLMKQDFTNDVLALKIRALNDRLMLAERGFLDAYGIKGREWFKHLVYGPQSNYECELEYLLCFVLLQEAESIEHVLFRCIWSKQVWFGCSLGLTLNFPSDKCFTQIWFHVLNMLQNIEHKEEVVCRFSFICWYMWKHICAKIMGKKDLNPTFVIIQSGKAHREYWCANMSSNRNQVVTNNFVQEEWERPANGIVKLNCDAALKNEKVGIEIIARDHHGKMVAGQKKEIQARMVYIAEAVVVREAVMLGINQRYASVIVESDSKTVIDEVVNQDRNGHSWRLYHLLVDIWKAAKGFSSCEFKHIKKSANKAADWAAKAAIETVRYENWVEKPPQSYFLHYIIK